jgi:ubiquinone/menaquinone biosynthesis C-methylase UbiE
MSRDISAIVSGIEQVRKRSKRAVLLGRLGARSAVFTVESVLKPAIEALQTGRWPEFPFSDRKLIAELRDEARAVVEQDLDRALDGQIPLSDVMDERPFEHLGRLPRIALDGWRATQQRLNGKASDLSPQAVAEGDGLPPYYLRCFHHQRDGYLSDESAALYDHQVEILFGGTAGAMRRRFLPSLREWAERRGSPSGRGLRILDVAAGTGRAALSVRRLLPEAQIDLLDLSGPYLRRAQARLSGQRRHSFIEADASAMPLGDGTYDAVYCIYLFHELPHAVRMRVLNEMGRVVREDGFVACVDSLQLMDRPSWGEILTRFPDDFHEPFYRDYIERCLSSMVSESAIAKKLGKTEGPQLDTSFLTKSVWWAGR